MRFYYRVFVAILVSISLNVYSADIEFTHPTLHMRERIDLNTKEFWQEKP